MEGFVTTSGYGQGVNTTGDLQEGVAGDILYLGTVDGGLALYSTNRAKCCSIGWLCNCFNASNLFLSRLLLFRH
jgi:hypothetical protein